MRVTHRKGAVDQRETSHCRKGPRELHGRNNLTKRRFPKRAKSPTVEAIPPSARCVLTGTQPNGTAFPAGEDRTCSNWTSSTKVRLW